MTEEALANLRTLLKTSPLAAISMLKGNSQARLEISLEELAPILADPEGAGYGEVVELIRTYYEGELAFYDGMEFEVRARLGVSELPPEVKETFEILSNDRSIGQYGRMISMLSATINNAAPGVGPFLTAEPIKPKKYRGR